MSAEIAPSKILWIKTPSLDCRFFFCKKAQNSLKKRVRNPCKGSVPNQTLVFMLAAVKILSVAFQHFYTRALVNVGTNERRAQMLLRVSQIRARWRGRLGICPIICGVKNWSTPRL